MIYCVCTFYILPKELEYYFNSDISDFEGSILVISIIISVVLTFLILFDLSQFKLGIWKKIDHIFYLGIFGYFIFLMVPNTITTIGLVINRANQSETLSKDFKIHRKDQSGDNVYVYGRYLENEYQGKLDRLYVGNEYFSKLNVSQIITLNLKKGILSIPFEPAIAD